ncbi:cytochrome P450 [Nocardia sp. BMG51109]|uniref:cytochrome P450 n=1 Tax=Nocardia sp. BMG51109 TaxID=1056816 RepID=UPI0004644093|nr:cytochrome P450 [Nocardia sp. BMG51109]
MPDDHTATEHSRPHADGQVGSAEHGDVGARILRLPPGADGHHLFREVRRRGPLVHSRKGLLFTASWTTANAILRSKDFGAVPTMVSGSNLPDWGNHLVHPLDDSFFSLDPPHHTRLRAAVAPWFARNSAPAWGTHIESVVDSCLDSLADRDSADLIRTLAEPVPVFTICRLLGVPAADLPTFTRWGHAITALMDGPRSDTEARRIRDVCAEMTDYFHRRITATAHQPGQGEGLIAGLAARCPVDMAERDVVATSGMMLLAGFATTVNLIGSGLRILLADAGQRRAARGNWGAVVEETLRHASPVQYVVRRAIRPTRVQGIRVPAHTPVVILLAGANRDPSVFAHAEDFDPTRTDVGHHLTFGTGIHYCMGTALARAEAHAVLGRFFTRFPDAAPNGPATPRPSRVLHGPATLPVRLTAPR